MTNNELSNTTETKKEELKTENTNATTSPPNNTGDQFGRLPIESLISAPIVAAAQGQQELSATYIDSLKKLAYTPNSTETNTLAFKYEHPVIKSDGTLDQTGELTIQVPLLTLVPIPAFTMDELDIDFSPEVKKTEMPTDQTQSSLLNQTIEPISDQES